MVLTCYGISMVIVSEGLEIYQLLQIVTAFAVRIHTICSGIN